MKKIKKEFGIEEIISRIPSHFPYLEFNKFGVAELHKSSDSVYGSYGKVMDAIYLDINENVYSGIITFEPYQYVLNNTNINILIGSNTYNNLSDDRLDEYVINEYVNLSDTKYKNEDEVRSENYVCCYYAKKVENYYYNENNGETKYYPAIIEFWQYNAKHETENSANSGIGRFNRRSYMPYLLCKTKTIDDMNLSMEDDNSNDNFTDVLYYRHIDTHKLIDNHFYELLGEEEKTSYEEYIFADKTIIATRDDYERMDETVRKEWTPLYYVSKEIIDQEAWNKLDSEEHELYEEYKYAHIITKSEFENLDETKCSTYQFKPHSFIKEGTDKIIFIEE